jgi:hypothetical protein
MSETKINDSRLLHDFWMTTGILLTIDPHHRGDLQLVIPVKVGQRWDAVRLHMK